MTAPAALWRPGGPLQPLRDLLARGGILAIPTESSYGLAVDPRSGAGVEAVYRVKERERGKPLPVVAADAAQITALGIDVATEPCRRALALWPAALTVALPLPTPLPAAAGGATLAVRIPDHPELRRLLVGLGSAVTATSANRSGEPPLLVAEEVAELLAGADAVVVDGGRLPGGAPSTLVAWDGAGWQVLRAGRYSLPG
jgi:L-threonylcarbamoyladenylate synthase